MECLSILLLIETTFSDYAKKILLGDKNKFKRNFGTSLYAILENWIPGGGSGFSGIPETQIIPNSAQYDYNYGTITLQPNLLYEVNISDSPYYNTGGYTFVTDTGDRDSSASGASYMSPFDPYESNPNLGEMFKNAEKGTFASQYVVFKWVLAHEMTHALSIGNPDILQSFIEHFWREDFQCKQIVERNKNREADEVLSDVIASYLYAPSLLEGETANVRAWIKGDLQRKLK
jgi:hypothetical protein